MKMAMAVRPLEIPPLSSRYVGYRLRRKFTNFWFPYGVEVAPQTESLNIARLPEWRPKIGGGLLGSHWDGGGALARHRLALGY
jgi:hypothetical protein